MPVYFRRLHRGLSSYKSVVFSLLLLLLCFAVVSGVWHHASSWAQQDNEERERAQKIAELERVGFRGLNPPKADNDLEKSRHEKWKEPKLPPMHEVDDCRYHDDKCKEEKKKQKIGQLENQFKNNGRAGGVQIAQRSRWFDWTRSALDPVIDLREPGQRSTKPAFAASPAVTDAGIGLAHHAAPAKAPTTLKAATAAAALQTLLLNQQMTERVKPKNRTGGPAEDLYSKNYHWSVPIISMPGRGGHGFNLSLHYNSLVWLRVGNTMYYDLDKSYLSPGFELNVPRIKGPYVNQETLKNSYLLILPSGAVTELCQVSAGSLYEAHDGSFLQYDASSSVNTIYAPDGTQYKFSGTTNLCTDIKDVNGNLITITYNAQSQINQIKDTTGHIYTFIYSSNFLVQIQDGGLNNANKPLANFYYTNTNTAITGAGNFKDNGTTPLATEYPAGNFTVLSAVLIAAGQAQHNFYYNAYGQVNQFAAGAWPTTLPTNPTIPPTPPTPTSLNAVLYQLNSNTTWYADCPYFRYRTDWAWDRNHEGGGDWTNIEYTFCQGACSIAPLPSALANIPLPDASGTTVPVAETTSCMMTYPDLHLARVYFYKYADNTVNAWRNGLPIRSEDFAVGSWSSPPKRWTATLWEQPLAANYYNNPRVKASCVGDDTPNKLVTKTTYTAPVVFPSGGLNSNRTIDFNLPMDVATCDSTSAVSPLRTSRTSYLTGASATPYLQRWMIGLPTETLVLDGGGATVAKSTLEYDNTALSQPPTPIQQDPAYNVQSMTIRGNVTRAKRWDVTGATPVAETVIMYNTSGSVYSIQAPSTKDPQNPTGPPITTSTTFSYTDDYYSNGGPLTNTGAGTLAFPTTVTAPGGLMSKMKYDWDWGLVVESKNPLNAFTAYTYSSTTGDLLKVQTPYNGTLYNYASTRTWVDTKTTVNLNDLTNVGSLHTTRKILNGFGQTSRVIQDFYPEASNALAYRVRAVRFDARGRVKKESRWMNSNSFGYLFPVGSGDDGRNNVVAYDYTTYTYDWKGRITLTANVDGTTNTATYAGCGCTGGQTVTLEDEGQMNGGTLQRRKQKLTYDALGRLQETLNYAFGGTTGYSKVVNTYTALDQITNVAATDLSVNPSKTQNTVMTYDGHGRMKGQQRPEQSAPTFYFYNDDDSYLRVYDGRRKNSAGNPTAATGAAADYYYADFTYNTRKLLTKIAYTTADGAPASNPTPWSDPAVPDPALPVVQAGTVTYAYDNAGNRTQMVYGPGTGQFFDADKGGGQITYAYDSLGGRVLQEKRKFNLMGYYKAFTPTSPGAGGITPCMGLTGGFRCLNDTYDINYEYYPSGQVKKVTMPQISSDSIDYEQRNDGSVGRVSGTPRDGVTDYAYDIKYRAWGAQKETTYGYNAYQITRMYNNRMQLVGSDDNSGSHKFAARYVYQPDGRLSFMKGETYGTPTMQGNRTLDRSFEYDSVGRVVKTRSASQAVITDGTPVSTEPAQLNQDYTYDAFGHMTSREGFYWFNPRYDNLYSNGNYLNRFTATYTNNRAVDGTVREGDIINFQTDERLRTWRYDQEGRTTWEYEPTPPQPPATPKPKTNFLYDVAGRQVRRMDSFTDVTSYGYDGDGNLMHSVRHTSSSGTWNGNATFFLRSSVLGESVAEINFTGVVTNNTSIVVAFNRKAHIYVNGVPTATRTYDLTTNKVTWAHRDANGTMQITGGSAATAQETYSLDPMGTEVESGNQMKVMDTFPGGNYSPPEEGMYIDGGGNSNSWGYNNPNPGNWGGVKCTLDGRYEDCGSVLGAVRGGGANITGVFRNGFVSPDALTLVNSVNFHVRATQEARGFKLVPKKIPGDPEGKFDGDRVVMVKEPIYGDGRGTLAGIEYVNMIAGEPQSAPGQVGRDEKNKHLYNLPATDSAGRSCLYGELLSFSAVGRNPNPIPHVWLKIPKGGYWESVGFGPISTGTEGPGHVEDNSNPDKYPEDYSKLYSACPETFKLLVDSINKSKKDTASNLYYVFNNNPNGTHIGKLKGASRGYNCAGWVCKRLEDAGIRPPKPSSAHGVYPWAFK